MAKKKQQEKKRVISRDFYRNASTHTHKHHHIHTLQKQPKKDSQVGRKKNARLFTHTHKNTENEFSFFFWSQNDDIQPNN